MALSININSKAGCINQLYYGGDIGAADCSNSIECTPLKKHTQYKYEFLVIYLISYNPICPPKQCQNGKNGTTITDPKDIANEHAVFTDNSSSAH